MWDSESEITKEGTLLESELSVRDDDSSSDTGKGKKRKNRSSSQAGVITKFSESIF